MNGIPEFAAVPIAPALFEYALEAMVLAPRRERKRTNLLSGCIAAYLEWIGLDEDEAVAPEHALEVGALAARFAALLDLVESGQFRPDMNDDTVRTAVIEAACSAVLIERDGKPAFQLLDFLARVPGGAG